MHNNSAIILGSMVHCLKVAGYHCTYKKRKLASGHKFYFTVSGKGNHLDFFSKVVPIIVRFYPKSYSTSSVFSPGTFSCVVAEY